MSGVHLIGPAGYHELLLRTWGAHGLQLVTHVKPEPGDGARLRSWLGTRAFLAWRFTDAAGFRDAAIEEAYHATPYAAAQWLAAAFLPMLAQNPEYQTVLVNNEPTLKSRESYLRLFEFTRHCIDIFNAHGWGVGLFSFARGTPELDIWQMPELHEVWRYALQRNASLPAGRENILSIHQYGSFMRNGPGSLFEEEAWHLKRFELQERPRLPEDLRRAPYAITEAGPDGGARGGWKGTYGDEWPTLVSDWRRYNEWLAQQPGCKGAAFFTLHQEGGFESFDIHHQPIAQALATQHYPAMKPAETVPVPPSVPAPAPVPEPPRGGGGVISHPSKHYSSRQGRSIDYYVAHGTDSPVGVSVARTLEYLTENDRKVSAHEFIHGDTAWVMVPDHLASHHAGFSILPGATSIAWTNERTWGMEMFHTTGQPITEATRRMGLLRMADAMKRNGHGTPGHVDRMVLGHFEIDTQGKTCPVNRRLFDIVRFRAELKAILGTPVVVTVTLPEHEQPATEDEAWAKAAWWAEEQQRQYVEHRQYLRASQIRESLMKYLARERDRWNKAG